MKICLRAQRAKIFENLPAQRAIRRVPTTVPHVRVHSVTLSVHTITRTSKAAREAEEEEAKAVRAETDAGPPGPALVGRTKRWRAMRAGGLPRFSKISRKFASVNGDLPNKNFASF